MDEKDKIIEGLKCQLEAEKQKSHEYYIEILSLNYLLRQSEIIKIDWDFMRTQFDALKVAYQSLEKIVSVK